MDLHLVSGFLGSGKTTSIITLSKLLMNMGKKVAVITNDQGKYLVDTAFIRASEIPSMEVQSGCFCSNFQDMITQLDELKNKVDPDIVFAEAIGSAGNLVGTVMQPLLASSDYSARSLSAFIDARLLLRITRNEYLPFSDSVNATLMSQLTESNYLIINKIDLLPKILLDEIKLHSHTKFPHKIIHFQSAFSDVDVMRWYELMSTHDSKTIVNSHFNLDLHQTALSRLKWIEKVYAFDHPKNVFPDILSTLLTIIEHLKHLTATIAHLKAIISYDEKFLKIGITSFNETDWQDELREHSSRSANMILNARIQSDESIEEYF